MGVEPCVDGSLAFFSGLPPSWAAMALRRASSTMVVQWILVGGKGPRSAAISTPERARASEVLLPLISSVAKLAAAMAVSQPKDWKEALSMTFLPVSYTHQTLPTKA